MKKIFSVAIIAMLAFSVTSCDRNNDNDNGQGQVNKTDARTIDFRGDMQVSSTNNSLYGYNNSLPQSLGFLNSDVLLIYRKTGIDGVNPIWKLLPSANYLTQGELNYDFDFTVNDFQINANADFDLLGQNAEFKNQYLNNQTFRVVAIPSDFVGSKNKNANNFENYEETIRKYNIDDSNVKLYQK